MPSTSHTLCVCTLNLDRVAWATQHPHLSIGNSLVTLVITTRIVRKANLPGMHLALLGKKDLGTIIYCDTVIQKNGFRYLYPPYHQLLKSQ